MKLKLSSSFVKRSLSSHSWIGLFIGAAMYLICLSGTLAVFYQEFERWEQPAVEEFHDYDPAIVDTAYREAVSQGLEVTHHMYVNLPTEGIPRLSVASEEAGRYVNADGSLGPEVEHEWTHLLLFLHLYLHLPASFGMIVVSAFGALLVSLVVSGFLAHPRIFKDAFNLRLNGSVRLEQVDIHNRLSVWGAPFHLMIAITGAYFGLALPLSALLAQVFYDGDTAAFTAEVYGDDPGLEQAPALPAIGAALARVGAESPGNAPMYVTVDRADEPERQFMVVGTDNPERLIWAEEYRLDAAGNLIDKLGWSDGEAGRQAIFSIYRLHFGHFGGFFVKLVYALFGLALTVVSVTGINIWLARRKTRDYLNNLWTGLVWGAPAALAVTALTQTVLAIPSTLLFWLGLVAAMTSAQLGNDDRRTKFRLKATTAGLLVLLLIAHVAKHGAAAFGPAALGVNAGLAATAAVLAFMARRAKRVEGPGRLEPDRVRA